MFHKLKKLWGPHTVDRFASWETTQLKRYNSRFNDPQSEAVDAFSQDWGAISVTSALPTIQNNSSGPPTPNSVQSRCDTDCSPVASATLVLDSPTDQRGVHSSPEHEVLVQDGEVGIRGTQKREMADRSIPDLWISSVTVGWSSEASSLLKHALAESTFAGYNQELERYCDFCRKRAVNPLAGSKAIVADYLELRTRSLTRPESTVKKISSFGDSRKPSSISEPLSLPNQNNLYQRSS